MIARSCITHHAKVDVKDRKFHQICLDILSSETSRLGKNGNHEKVKKLISELVSRNGRLTNKLKPLRVSPATRRTATAIMGKRHVSRKKASVTTSENGTKKILFAKNKVKNIKNKNEKSSWFSRIFKISNKTTV